MEEGGYIIPKIWARNGEKVARREIDLRIKFGWPLGDWPKYLKGFQRILKGEKEDEKYKRRSLGEV